MDIAAAKKRCEAATGVYRFHPPKRGNPPYSLDRYKGGAWETVADYGADWDEATFSAHARTDLPAALEALEEAIKSYEDMRHSWYEEHVGLLEAQGKLEAVDEWYAELGSWGHIMLPRLDRTLHGSKEGDE